LNLPDPDDKLRDIKLMKLDFHSIFGGDSTL
jgi:hypothetical protein